MFRLFPFLFVLLCLCKNIQPLTAQSETQSSLYQWYILGINGRISSKWSVSFNRQYSRPSQSKAPFDYYLDDFRAFRSLGKSWGINAGLAYLISSPDTEEPTIKRRYSLGLSFQNNLVEQLRLSTRITAERHLQERRYDGRLVGTARLDYTGIELFNQMEIRPFVIGQLYYFLGGDWIKQYDESGAFARRSPTYGFHRMRVRFGLTVSPLNWVQVSAFYGIQNEFNTPQAILAHHQVNEINPSTGKITRPFDNYKAWGLGLTFFIRAKKKSKQRSQSESVDTE